MRAGNDLVPAASEWAMTIDFYRPGDVLNLLRLLSFISLLVCKDLWSPV